MGLSHPNAIMADAAAIAAHKKRTFRKFSFRGVDLDQLLELDSAALMDLVASRARRRFSRGLKRKPMALVKKRRKAKKEAAPMEKPEPVKTMLRNMIIVPEMIGMYLAEFAITYKPPRHGRPGIGSTHSSRFI